MKKRLLVALPILFLLLAGSAAGQNQQANRQLSLTVTAPSGHFVNLTWTDSDSTVVGYNVYRSQNTSGPFSLLNPKLLTSTSYTDSVVTAGATYYYVATAVDGSGSESAYSNQATAVIPSP